MRVIRPVGMLPVLVILGPALAPAAGPDAAAEEVLKEKGLAKAGRVYVIEAEEPVLAKMTEVRSAFAAYVTAADRQATSARAAEHSAALEERRVELQERLDDLNQQINLQGNSQGGGMRPGGMNPQQAAFLNPVVNQRDQIKFAVAQITQEPKSLKNQVAPDKGNALDEDVKTKGEAFKAALAELRPQVDAVTKTYVELAADESVQKALTDVKRASATKLKLGPSDAFLAGARELDVAEQRFLGKKAAVVSKKKPRSRR